MLSHSRFHVCAKFLLFIRFFVPGYLSAFFAVRGFIDSLNSLRKLRLFFYVRITNRHFFTSVCPIINEGHKNGYLS